MREPRITKTAKRAPLSIAELRLRRKCASLVILFWRPVEQAGYFEPRLDSFYQMRENNISALRKNSREVAGLFFYYSTDG